MSSRSVLVISAEPDGRPSTAALRRLVEGLRAEGAVVRVWFLRDGPERAQWPDARIIDDLRGWAPVAIARRLRLEPLASAIGGRRLRAWRRQVAADVVVLDDGLGGRLLDPADPPPVVLRTNPVPPSVPHDEVPWTGRVAGVIDGAGGGVPVSGTSAGGWRLAEPPPPRVSATEPSPGEALAPSGVRDLLGLPQEVPLVAWLVGGAGDLPDPALDLVGQLANPAGPEVHLLWAGPSLTQEDLARLAATAARVGLAERVHGRTQRPPALLAACEAVVDPTGSLPTHEVDALQQAGVVVVRPQGGGGPWSPPWRGDPASTARALRGALAVERARRATLEVQRRDLGGFAVVLHRALSQPAR